MLTRRSLLAAPAVLGAGSVLSSALAKAPLANAPTPGAYRFKIGTIEVTAVADGTIALGLELIPAAKTDAAAVGQLLQQAALSPQAPIRNYVNTFAINTGDRLVLVDSGTGPIKAFGPDLGKVPKHLAAAGLDPAAVDAVFLTHMHPDHVGGLVLDGKPAFPNAEIVVGETEYDFWNDAGIMAQAPAEAKPFFQIAQDSTKPYGSRVRQVTQGEIAPGLSIVPAPGHTPGHAGLRVSSGNEQLLIFADTIVIPQLQFDRPEWSIAFDADQAGAAETRKRILDQAATDRILVAGSHLPFPAVGHVTRRGGAYAFVPQLWPS